MSKHPQFNYYLYFFATSDIDLKASEIYTIFKGFLYEEEWKRIILTQLCKYLGSSDFSFCHVWIITLIIRVKCFSIVLQLNYIAREFLKSNYPDQWDSKRSAA